MNKKQKEGFSIKKAFTLLELLIVIIVIAIIASIGIPRYTGTVDKARDAEAKRTLVAISKVEVLIYTSTGEYLPANEITNGATIGADLDSDPGNDVEMRIPNSEHFSYSKSGNLLRATATSPTGRNWQLNLTTGQITTF